MKGNWTVVMDSEIAKDISKDIKDWGYSSREAFVIAAHKKEKAERMAANAKRSARK